MKIHWHRSRSSLVALAASGVLFLSSHAGAWGEQGHQIIGTIAMTRINAQTRAAVIELLGDDDLAKAGLWADQIRGDADYDWAKPLHYVNAPRTAERVEMDRDCPGGECVVGAIGKFLAIAVDQSKPIEERREALKFAVHFIGDIHQPLHAGYKDDLGGNRISVIAFGDIKTNLEVASWQAQLDPLAWANESMSITRKIYHDLPADAKVGEAYYQANFPIISHRLAAAGVRMAAILDKAFADWKQVKKVDGGIAPTPTQVPTPTPTPVPAPSSKPTP